MEDIVILRTATRLLKLNCSRQLWVSLRIMLPSGLPCPTTFNGPFRALCGPQHVHNLSS